MFSITGKQKPHIPKLGGSALLCREFGAANTSSGSRALVQPVLVATVQSQGGTREGRYWHGRLSLFLFRTQAAWVAPPGLCVPAWPPCSPPAVSPLPQMGERASLLEPLPPSSAAPPHPPPPEPSFKATAWLQRPPPAPSGLLVWRRPDRRAEERKSVREGAVPGETSAAWRTQFSSIQLDPRLHHSDLLCTSRTLSRFRASGQDLIVPWVAEIINRSHLSATQSCLRRCKVCSWRALIDSALNCQSAWVFGCNGAYTHQLTAPLAVKPSPGVSTPGRASSRRLHLAQGWYLGDTGRRQGTRCMCGWAQRDLMRFLPFSKVNFY